MIRFRTFQGRVVFFFLGLLSLVQLVVFLTVDITNTRYAKRQIEVALEVGAVGFNRLIELRTEQLSQSMRILISDPAFKSAVARNSISATKLLLQSYSERVRADLMMLVSADQSLLADSGRSGGGAIPEELKTLIRSAGKSERAWAIITIGERAYQVLVLPVAAPGHLSWLVTGFSVGDELASDLSQFTKLGISFLHAGADGKPGVLASSLPAAQRGALAAAFATIVAGGDRIVELSIAGEDFLNLVTPLGIAGNKPVSVIMQRSLEQELKPFQQLRAAVFVLSCGGLVLSLFGAFYIARSVTRPVRALASAARSVEQGDYAQPVEVAQEDELGDLAATFNRMIRGLAERDKVRNLLGKVVSHAIAEKLLSQEVLLGGEEREVTVMFADLRGFTSFCETQPAQQVVEVLNLYLTRISEIIEANNGVVDKYLGDGVMALFGAPVSYEDDAGNALKAALEVRAALGEMNTANQSRGMPSLDVGIGVNTAVVVAGNMGSPTRLNYTVVGDGVNLAARLQAMAKEGVYGMGVITTQATLARTRRPFNTKLLGEVEVRGKSAQVTIYSVLGESDARPA
jgi:adenylate cyclase